MGERPLDLLSLGDWLGAAVAAGVTYVDAELIAEAQTDDVRKFDWDEPARNERLRALWQTIKAADRPDSILRWDICSSGSVKAAMSQPGAGSRPRMWKGTPSVEFDDPRLQDVIDDWRHPTLRIWRRPWVRAAIVNGYPVEFRVFVRDDQVVGISSYYPQRPLSIAWRPVIDKVEWLARRLIAAAGRMSHWRIADCGLDPDRLHCTLDFLVEPDPHQDAAFPIFLEGGPPHVAGSWGAASCCFREGEVRGVALRDLNHCEAGHG